MTDEERKAISWLSALEIKSEYEATNKEIVLNLINKQEKAIDRMAEKLSKVPMYRLKSKDNTYRAENIDVVAMIIEEIKEYFMEDK